MLYRIAAGQLEQIDSAVGKGPFVGLYPFDQADAACRQWGLPAAVLQESVRSRNSKFESHDTFDYISLNIPIHQGQGGGFNRVGIFIKQDLLLIFCRGQEDVKGILEIDALRGKASVSRVLWAYLASLTGRDAQGIEDMEQQVEELETKLLEKSKTDCVQEIVLLRRRVTALKRFYDQLCMLYDGLIENENGLFDREGIKRFKILKHRADRLYNSVRDLQEYITQVRESYQAQVDINLNNIMKLFTVITVIFSPLALIVGWYGMNVKMPEFGWRFGYPFVAGLCVLSVVLCILLFRRKKWF